MDLQAVRLNLLMLDARHASVLQSSGRLIVQSTGCERRWPAEGLMASAVASAVTQHLVPVICRLLVHAAELCRHTRAQTQRDRQQNNLTFDGVAMSVRVRGRSTRSQTQAQTCVRNTF